MVKDEDLQVLNERMKIMDPNENEIYKFLGVAQADGIKTEEVYSRVKEEMNRRMNIITRTELNDKNPVKAINTKVIYPLQLIQCIFVNSLNLNRQN